MSLVHWQPMRDLENLRRQMDRLFDEWTLPRSEFSLPTSDEIAWVPAIELKETDRDIILKAQIPGIEAKDLNVEVSEDRVSISGEHQQQKQTEEKGYFRSEFN
ncbi:MAG: Hsp20/alpha crystallin family protein [Hydrococcus sp. Prado102]|jgi:HSP20 family protein|nr:Hsp20/alpha crystallin family protein [Hydrococcus sp. Prado102]